ncbi:MAG: hypothetical protein HY425_00915 [Candidatus Levybacteria bacterium]|nr:hypothetical protein [Candidatus Levybacteria bacterium]
MKKPYLLILFLIGLTIVLSVVKSVAYNRLSTSGVFVGKLEDKVDYYETQNAILSEKLLTFSSLTYIANKAVELGFVKEDSPLMVLKTSVSLAVKR